MAKEHGGLGVRDLERTNQALISKLTWRFLEAKDTSLWKRLLTAKYLDKECFWDRNSTASSSHTWRCMLSTREIIRPQICWELGSGNQIKIWTEPWVRHLPGFRVQTNPEAQAHLSYVHELFLPNSLRWDLQLLYHIFPLHEANAISRIQPNGGEDKLLWNATSTGKFKCSSVYKQLTNELPSVSNISNGVFSNWKGLWKIKGIAPRVLLFVWKALRGAIAVAHRLSRFTNIVSLCSRCGKEDETIDHCLIHCSFSKAVWDLFPCHLQPLNRGLSDFVDFLLALQEKDDFRLACAIMWANWRSRNDMVFRQTMVSSQQTYRWGITYFEDYKDPIQPIVDPQHMAATVADIIDSTHAWSLPNVGVVKINVDGACKRGRGAAGAVARDHTGAFLGCMTIFIDLTSPLIAEALSFELGLSLAKKLHIPLVSIEGDSATVVACISSDNATDWRIDREIKSCKSLLLPNPGWSCSYVPRICNTVAHSLAAYALEFELSKNWEGGMPPAPILDSLFADLAILRS